MKKVVGILATIVVCLRAYAVFGMDQALVPAGGGGRRPNIGGVVAALAMANIQFGQIPQAQPIFAHPPAHADAAEDDPRCSHGKTADETCARCEHIADHLAPYEPSDDGIDDDGGYGGDFPGGILGTIMEGDSSDDDGGCMSARYNAAGTDETVAVTGKGSGRGGSRQGSGRKSVASGGSRNGERSSKRPRGDHDSTNEVSGETGAEASADAITDSEETAALRVDTAPGAMRMERGGESFVSEAVLGEFEGRLRTVVGDMVQGLEVQYQSISKQLAEKGEAISALEGKFSLSLLF